MSIQQLNPKQYTHRSDEIHASWITTHKRIKNMSRLERCTKNIPLYGRFIDWHKGGGSAGLNFGFFSGSDYSFIFSCVINMSWLHLQIHICLYINFFVMYDWGWIFSMIRLLKYISNITFFKTYETNELTLN